MKKIIVIVILLNIIHLFSQQQYNYLPLNIGNTWVYYGNSATTFCHNSSWLDKYRITGTIQVNGNTYFTFSHQRLYFEGNCGGSIRLFQNDLPIRVDTLTKNIYKKDNCNSLDEYLVDSLKSKKNDTARSCIYNAIVCSDTAKFYFCSDSLQSKTFRPGFWESGIIQRYAKNTGLVYYYNYPGGGSGSEQIGLRGCVINGVTCGDTSMPLGIQIISSEIPQTYVLEQNYPNPFNPVTYIKFSIPKSGFVNLIVFDLQGIETETLVNENLAAGIYEADFDASNFSSGMYFYRLISGDYSETKKMVLVK